MSTKELDVLEKEIIKADFIPKDYNVKDAITEEILLTSWEINSRTPRFFTKWSQENLELFKDTDTFKDDKAQDYAFTLD